MKRPSVPAAGATDTDKLLATTVGILEDMKAVDLSVIDLRGRGNALFDAMVICSSTSQRHGQAMADRLLAAYKSDKVAMHGVEGPGMMGWTLIDADAVLVHIFSAEARELYDLDSLWDMPE